MKLLLTLPEYEGYIHWMLRKHPRSTMISTYCLGSWPRIKEFLPRHPRRCRVLVGVPRRVSLKQQESYQTITRMFPGVLWRFRFDHHAKLYLATYSNGTCTALTGGRNFPPSVSDDISIVVGGATAKALRKQFMDWWRDASEELP